MFRKTSKSRDMTRRLGTIAAVSSVGMLAMGGTAAAAVTYDPATGHGFVGKGEVQIAYGWNNSALQKNAKDVTFTSSQAASQALSQSATQDGTQAVTQSLTQEVSCTINQKKQTHTRDGERAGLRTGSRSGSRTGSRSGTLAGTILSSIAYDPRVKNQITGFNLTGFLNTAFMATGANEFGDWTFESYTFGAPTMGETTWGDWVSEPTENPADCLGGNPHATDVSDVTTEGAITDGAITDGAITEGAIAYGAVTATGDALLYVNYKGVAVHLPVTPAV